jgi:isopenicillin-N epimerase
LEREPVRFLAHALGELWERARDALASFVRVSPDDLVFVNNATTGVNTVLRTLEWKPGDEILMIDHGYAACLNAARYVAGRTGAKLVTAHVPFPLASPDEVFDAICAAASARTKLAIIDHVTSPTGLVLPIERIAKELEGRGISVMVDGAHAPGMVDLDIPSIGASWYTGNCHKWLCTPKGAALLWVREDKHELTRPLVISHAGSMTGRDRFHGEFDWVGTDDPTAVLCIPDAIEWLGAQLPGGWPELRKHNRDLLIAARRLLLERWSIAPPCPESMLGNLAAIPLTDSKDARPGHQGTDSLHAHLFEKHRIEVPVYSFPVFPKRAMRISAQLYNRIEEYQTLADVVAPLS